MGNSCSCSRLSGHLMRLRLTAFPFSFPHGCVLLQQLTTQFNTRQSTLIRPNYQTTSFANSKKSRKIPKNPQNPQKMQRKTIEKSTNCRKIEGKTRKIPKIPKKCNDKSTTCRKIEVKPRKIPKFPIIHLPLPLVHLFTARCHELCITLIVTARCHVVCALVARWQHRLELCT